MFVSIWRLATAARSEPASLRGISAEPRIAESANSTESLKAMSAEGYGDRIAFRFAGGVTAPQILSAARKFQARHGNLGMVVLDHLGCFDAGHPRASIQEQIELSMGQLGGSRRR